jgi:class 3 adenylate cyclase
MLFVALDLGEGSMVQTSTKRPNVTPRSWPAGAGDERYLAIMFVDMRGSTRLAEGRLPFDTVFVINQFLNAVG